MTNKEKDQIAAEAWKNIKRDTVAIYRAPTQEENHRAISHIKSAIEKAVRPWQDIGTREWHNGFAAAVEAHKENQSRAAASPATASEPMKCTHPDEDVCPMCKPDSASTGKVQEAIDRLRNEIIIYRSGSSSYNQFANDIEIVCNAATPSSGGSTGEKWTLTEVIEMIGEPVSRLDIRKAAERIYERHNATLQP